MIQINDERKDVVFHDKAKEVIKGFSKSARFDIGSLLFDLQCGENIGMPDARPMPEVERGVYELRVRDADGIYRLFYYLKSAKGIFGVSRLHKENAGHATKRN